jgi:hypothetical protein
MTRFRQLLQPSTETSPGQEQRRASESLPGAIAASPFHPWCGRADFDDGLLILVAPYSQYDLALLEEMEARAPTIPVYVGNLMDYPSLDALKNDVPDVGGSPATPIAKHWSRSVPGPTVSGKAARDMIASLLGVNPAKFNQRLLNASPRLQAVPA